VRHLTFATKALAESHEAKLRTAAREGEAFDTATGQPLSTMSRGQDRGNEISWYEFACPFVDMKWHEVAPNSRRSIADALAAATTALLACQAESKKRATAAASPCRVGSRLPVPHRNRPAGDRDRSSGTTENGGKR
jgi:hypothetical protein